MSQQQETIEDIIAEKRRRADEIERDCAEKMKRGEMISDCYARELVADIRREADRLEAALKRELSKNASKNGADFGQLGDVAKLREALEFIAHYNDNEAQMDDPCCADGHILAGKAKEALGIKEKERGAK